MAILSPLLLVALSEVGLRLAGYGYPTSFFRPATVGGQSVFVENDKFAWRFLPPAIARSPTATVVPASKAPGTYRIILFGESAALGDPRPAYGFGRYLEVLLRERFPAMRFEVVCAAMTAINSHAIMPIARECSRLEGDLWIVYMGNNEMEGPFGITNPFGPCAPSVTFVRTVLALKATRVGQLLSALLGRVRSAESEDPVWAGMKTMAQNPVTPDDPAKARIYRGFQRNLEDLVEIGLRAKATVLLSTVASNLRDCAPFASVPAPGLANGEQPEWESLMARAQAAITNRDWGQAIDRLQKALALDNRSAIAHFQLGQCWLAETNAGLAHAEFGQARDTDALPFRADGHINTIIESTARSYTRRGVVLFDAESALAADAPAKTPGSESFFEHVHLTFDGNYRLALALARQVAAHLPPAAQAGRRSDWADPDLCARRLGLTDWNRYSAYESVLQRIQDAPFTNQLNHVAQVRALQARLSELKALLTPDHLMDARAVYEEALARNAGDFRLHQNFAEFLEATGEFAEAKQHWERVRDLTPQECLPYYYLARLETRLGDYPAAEADFSRALTLRPDFPEARIGLGQSLARQGKPDQAIAEYRKVIEHQPGNAVAHLRLADVLASQNKRAEAVDELRQAVSLQPTLWEARYYLGVELVVQDKIKEAGEQFAEVVRLRPDFAPGQLNYGVALAKQGLFKEAALHFKETLRIDPGNTKAASYLRSLESGERRATGSPLESSSKP